MVSALILALALAVGPTRTPSPEAPPLPRMAIIIDDLGYVSRDQAVLALPGAVTVAVLPFSPHGAALAEDAHRRGKEVMIHLPMASDGEHHLGPGGITADMGEAQVRAQVAAAVAAVPHARGINNHMGSRMTASLSHMRWTMAAIAAHPHLYFIDSRTTAATVAEQTARSFGIASQRRHVFLDPDPSPATVARQFAELLARAQRGEQPIAIGHPYPATLAYLQRLLPRLDELGVALVPASALVHAPHPPLLAAMDSLRQSLRWPTAAASAVCLQEPPALPLLMPAHELAGTVSSSSRSR